MGAAASLLSAWRESAATEYPTGHVTAATAHITANGTAAIRPAITAATAHITANGTTAIRPAIVTAAARSAATGHAGTRTGCLGSLRFGVGRHRRWLYSPEILIFHFARG